MRGPAVVCLCGSTRWPQAFELANMHLSLRGKIVISVGMHGHADQPTGARFLTSDGDESTPEKQGLDKLHFRKIDLADEIYVVNVGGYVGSSTRREIAYARSQSKAVRFMFPDAAPDDEFEKARPAALTARSRSAAVSEQPPGGESSSSHLSLPDHSPDPQEGQG